MKRTKLADRELPDYNRGEEIMNMVTHIVGGALGIAILVLCVVFSALKHSPRLVVGSAVYGTSVVTLYTMSSIYHGLKISMAKKVFQVIDHCMIFFMICGTYTPLVLGPIMDYSRAWGWGMFGFVWGVSATVCTFTAIDWKKYNLISMLGYILVGWCIVFAGKITLIAIGHDAFKWLLYGGVAYMIGVILYGLGVKIRYMHSVFHIFIVLGSILQFFGIFFFVILK